MMMIFDFIWKWKRVVVELKLSIGYDPLIDNGELSSEVIITAIPVNDTRSTKNDSELTQPIENWQLTQNWFQPPSRSIHFLLVSEICNMLWWTGAVEVMLPTRVTGCIHSPT